MNKKLIFLVLLVCLLAVVAVVAFGQSSPSQNVRWEYTRIVDYNSGPSISDANRLGAEGWELVATAGNSTLYFKRRLP